MSLPVKLSDHLVLDARLISGAANRSIAGQIEFWAGLGRAIEVLLRSPELSALQRVGQRTPLGTALARPGTSVGDRQLAQVLRSRPFPHYEPAPGAQGLLLRIEENGARTVGRFVRRTFVPVNAPRKKAGTPRDTRRTR